MKNCLPKFAVGLIAFVFAVSASANENQIRQAVETKFRVSVEGVAPAPLPGLWEVRVRTQDGTPHIVYTDPSGNYFIDGNILDLRNGRDLTDERMRELLKVKVDQLPLEQAVKVQRGSGRRVLVMFSDPYCPFCQKFEKVLQQVDDITVYVFMIPIIRPENAAHSKAVWCSPDRAKAWLDLALYHKPPAVSPNCDNPIEKNLKLQRRLRINSTPTLLLPNGQRVSAGLSLEDLKAVLDQPFASSSERR